ncbi:7-carboxy-7-deazaguanine synthase, Cx14CxxC type [Mesorhizobium albiziae]|uniref:7-carboxy-7-deazaguanine synthase n=1 Tax=Neomesorhizobium albiziae TaxID=335020 RepID=A0A1I4DR03_9HYPH|nr:7-carboxy-7-deazaguanine synthase [Mesorhizobium albiziae]GLS33728.1 7-carboxy-7-deazaguanine synthase [Mesorhizobium albiziae]SFK96044.1 7-carboxy-7-deazaguanine synthase, Cx14CxxC type [Mesorhizobium albiziae]
MAYAVKEIFYTLQGEGQNAGRAAVFCRFAGCNLWSGREADRSKAICQFCDTDFVGTNGDGGGRFATANDLAQAIAQKWSSGDTRRRFAVLTGGEPLLQLDTSLVEALHAEGFAIAVETNGTLTPPPGIDWICVSPKAGAPVKLTRGNELKLVFPQAGAEPERFEALEFDHFLLQPMDGSARIPNTQAALEFCLANPRWQLCLQTHKQLGIR